MDWGCTIVEMRSPLFNLPSLGTIHTQGHGLTLFVLLFGSDLVFLHYIFLVTLAVPVVGAFRRKPKWRMFSLGSFLSAVGFLMVQYHRAGSQGLVFYIERDEFGYGYTQINFFSLVVVGVVFLPLSAACAFDRIRSEQ